MAIKDKVVKWFIQNIIIPQQEIIDKPGFIVTQFSDKGRQVFLREIFLPESIIVNLEKEIVKKFGKRGKEALYSAGKMFGYSYAARSFFPNITSSSAKEFERFIYMWIRYMETVYGKITYECDIKSKKITLHLDEFLICSQNGIGYFITSGSFAGFWAYLIDDWSVDAVQTKCRGRGDSFCEVVAGPKKLSESKRLELQKVKNTIALWDYNLERSINAIRPCSFNIKSFKDFLDSNIFKYENGIVTRDTERYFIIESSALYFLESELLKIDKSNKILFDISFKYGKSISEVNGKNYCERISTYISAMGYGDVCIFEKNKAIYVSSDYFPWTPYAENINFAYYRGFISGLLSGSGGKTILLKNITRDLSKGFLRISISE